MNDQPSPIPAELLEFLSGMIAAANWHRTQYVSKHEYIRVSEEPVLFQALCAAIDQYSYTENFMGQPYRYLNIGEYRYWHFHIILNRALHTDAPGW